MANTPHFRAPNRYNGAMSEEEYRILYRVLGIEPGCGWEELRRKHRAAVRAWHPDRFHDNEPRRAAAEEKTKELNRAFQRLEKYYKKHGTLPHVGRPETVPPSHERPRPQPRTETEAGPPRDAETSHAGAEGSAAATGGGRKRRPFRFRNVALATIAALSYFVWTANLDERTPPPVPAPEPASRSTPEPPPASLRQLKEDFSKSASGQYFGFGSSIGEVYSAQGIPTRVDGNTWYYGKSRIVFKDGVVIRWVESSSDPLNVRLEPSGDKPQPKVFGIGSTKEEVRAVQGQPLSETERTWMYNVSRVYFERGRVTGWYDSPLDPLKIEKQAQLH